MGRTSEASVTFTPPAHDPDDRYVHYPGFVEAREFGELFHVAPIDARDSILAAGLDTTQRLFEQIERPAGVYVWRALEYALFWQEQCEGRMLLGPQDIWRINGAGLVVHPDPYTSYGRWGDDYAWYVPQPVPSDKLTLVVAAGDSSILAPCS